MGTSRDHAYRDHAGNCDPRRKPIDGPLQVGPGNPQNAHDEADPTTCVGKHFVVPGLPLLQNNDRIDGQEHDGTNQDHQPTVIGRFVG